MVANPKPCVHWHLTYLPKDDVLHCTEEYPEVLTLLRLTTSPDKYLIESVQGWQPECPHALDPVAS